MNFDRLVQEEEAYEPVMLTVPAKKASENPQNAKNPAKTEELDVDSLDSEKVGGTVLCTHY